MKRKETKMKRKEKKNEEKGARTLSAIATA